RFINYGQYVSTVMRAVQPDEQSQVPALGKTAVAPERMSRTMVKAVEDTPMKFAPISARLQQWVDERRYLQSEVAVKDVAAALDTTPRRLNEYFSEVVGEDFVKWRMRMRLQYACQLIDQNPDRAMQEIAVESGFGDRSYFYRKFSEVMGMTVTQYKQQAKLQLTRTRHDYSGNE
ncbi:MAG: AraC family transcriptional regulator, partial [Muribaculaceae bacterium]|nr:AraC family transcriptional regulator [Muribaculaceae bacterium]